MKTLTDIRKTIETVVDPNRIKYRGIKSSLSIRRFWGKGERWKQKRERALLPLPLPHLKSPLP